MKVANKMSYSVEKDKAATMMFNIIIKNDPNISIYRFPNFSCNNGKKNYAKNPAIPMEMVL